MPEKEGREGGSGGEKVLRETEQGLGDGGMQERKGSRAVSESVGRVSACVLLGVERDQWMKW